MTPLRDHWTTFIDRQHRLPAGPVGRLIGERMRRQHLPETIWSVALLDLQPEDRVLEIGFGAGGGLARVLETVREGHVTGMDLSPTMVRAARRRFRASLSEGRLALMQGDVATLPFAPASFDRIFSIHTFYFWPDQEATLRHLTSLLAPGGRLVVTFATAKTLPNGERELWPLHERAMDLASRLGADFLTGPDSREFNNVAITVVRGQ